MWRGDILNDYELFDVSSIRHRDGIPWYDAPAPKRRGHKHEAQTTSNRISRCVCGALRFFDDPVWLEEPTGPRFAAEEKKWWRFW